MSVVADFAYADSGPAQAASSPSPLDGIGDAAGDPDADDDHDKGSHQDRQEVLPKPVALELV